MRNKPYSLYLIALVIIILILESVLLVVAFKWFGLWPVLIWVGATAMTGGYLLYQQYFQMEQIRAELKAAFAEEEDTIKPTEVIFKKLIFPFIGAWLLILPGFITDLLAALCFLPFLPRLMGRWITLKPRREAEPNQSSAPPRPSARPTRKGKPKRKR